jgi:Cu/Ag efflux pump CusA
MLKTSVEAQFFIPMVISLAFGVLVSTIVTLLFVPCLYLFPSNVQNRKSLGDELARLEPGQAP